MTSIKPKSPLAQQLTGLLSCYPTIRLAILFGSQANAGQPKRLDSDIDLAILADSPLNSTFKMQLIETIGAELGRSANAAWMLHKRAMAELALALRDLRRGRAPAGAPQAAGERVRFGAFVLDLGTRELRRGDESLKLTSGEFAVLAAMVQRPRQPLTRDQLMSFARGREHEAFERSMDVMISRLRRLVEDDPKRPRWLQTIWGHGYVFVPDSTS